jgi:hypothetical protein
MGVDDWLKGSGFGILWDPVPCFIGYEVTIIMNKFIVSYCKWAGKTAWVGTAYIDKLETYSAIQPGRVSVLDIWTTCVTLYTSVIPR